MRIRLITDLHSQNHKGDFSFIPFYILSGSNETH